MHYTKFKMQDVSSGLVVPRFCAAWIYFTLIAYTSNLEVIPIEKEARGKWCGNILAALYVLLFIPRFSFHTGLQYFGRSSCQFQQFIVLSQVHGCQLVLFLPWNIYFSFFGQSSRVPCC